MFNTEKVAKNIKKARAQCNMTQMDLADEMGVSYQAVSNWERGNSMPDISKLPELCKILNISFEELVGEESEASQVAKKVMEHKTSDITLEDLVQIAPIVKPDVIRKTANEAINQEETISFSTLVGLAPFMDSETLDQLALRLMDVDIKKMCGLAPFLSDKTLDQIVTITLNTEGGKISDMIGLAPFLSKSTLQKVLDYGKQTGQTKELLAFAPFASKEMIQGLVGNCNFSFHNFKDEFEGNHFEEEDEEEDDEEVAARLANQALKAGEDVTKYLRNMDEDDVAELAMKAYKMGQPIEEYLEYMEEDGVKELLLLVMKERKIKE